VMHYIGMEAMIMPVSLSYDVNVVVLSVVIAYVASYFALFLFLRLRNQSSASWLKWLSAIIMGGAICGMHYMGMEAAKFYSSQGLTDDAHGLDLFLLYGTAITIVILLLISWGAIYFERHTFERMAYEDSLTKLPNRYEMNLFFEKGIGNEKVGVLFIDLDQFKIVNDRFGHHIGDQLLLEFSKRLRPLIGADQKLFRIGGDEFLFIVRNGEPKEVEQIAEQILEIVSKPFYIEGHELFITASIGICVGPLKTLNAHTLLSNADTAMYKAKEGGENRYVVFDSEMAKKEKQRMELEKDLFTALDNNQFHIVYQPKWDVKENRLYGFEGLLRWEHPRLGTIFPNEFIPIAEETGDIIPITRWVLENACFQCKTWENQGQIFPVSINLSTQVFHSNILFEWVQSVLEKTNLDAHLLELEITESMVFDNIDKVIAQLQNIRSLGVKVSMDDFGTGYSSIGLLDRIPIDILKLDKIFVNDLERPKKRAIINAIVVMAESLGVKVVAEGVENREQVKILTQLGCYIMQGYFYSKPMKAHEINDWIINQAQNTV